MITRLLECALTQRLGQRKVIFGVESRTGWQDNIGQYNRSGQSKKRAFEILLSKISVVCLSEMTQGCCGRIFSYQTV